MNEKQLLDRLKREADTITPPETLSPEAIERMLRDAGKNQAGLPPESDTDSILKKGGSSMKKHTSFSHYAMRFGSLAAIFVLGITVLWQANQISSLKENQAPLPQGNESTVKSSETEGNENAAVSAQTEENENAVKNSEMEANVSSQAASADAKNISSAESSVLPEDTLTYADSYEQVYNTLKEKLGLSLYGRDSGFEDAYAEAATLGSTSGSDDSVSVTSSSDVQSKNDYSETNLQEAGVDEGDIVKTDGQYLYILKKDMSFSIISANGSDLSLCSTTALDTSSLSDPSVKELYLDGDQLTVLFEGRQTSLEEEDGVYYTASASASSLCIYDISDRNAPKLTGTVTQEGWYSASRKVGEYLYLFTSYRPSLLDTCEASTLAPRVNGTAIPAGSFYLPEHPTSQQYLVITAIDLSANGNVTDQKVLVSGADNFYVSTENIYIATENYSSDDTFTELAKFRYDDGHIIGIAAGSVRGYLNNSFSLNEYNGYLRAVSTYYDSSADDWTEKNLLTVFDENLKQVSTIDDIASGETIRSARFLGDTGYFVTFRQTDPLFCVDLSDPASPKITDELKVSGFSSYLHFYGENLLLGIGYEADESTGEATGTKLSMFDLSDPTELKEVNRIVIPGITWVPAIDDYKSILVDSDKNLIGFYCDGRYLVYSYDSRNGFERLLVYDFFEDDLMESAQYNTMRGLYISDTLYLAGDGFVVPFDLTDGCSKQNVFRY